jgi:hypothetical protein
VDLAWAELHLILNSLDPYLGWFAISLCFSDGKRQDARLKSLGFLWDVLEWDNELDSTIFTTWNLVLLPGS